MKFCAGLHTDKVDLGAEFVSGDGVAAVARALEDAGFDAAFVTEHPFPDDGYLGYLGHHALDPFVTLATVAAATTRLRIMTHICVVRTTTRTYSRRPSRPSTCCRAEYCDLVTSFGADMLRA